MLSRYEKRLGRLAGRLNGLPQELGYNGFLLLCRMFATKKKGTKPSHYLSLHTIPTLLPKWRDLAGALSRYLFLDRWDSR